MILDQEERGIDTDGRLMVLEQLATHTDLAPRVARGLLSLMPQLRNVPCYHYGNDRATLFVSILLYVLSV